MPPHRSYDCAIELFPGTILPYRVYPLSLSEQKNMEEYVQEALQQGYIRPSTSPASAGLFFIFYFIFYFLFFYFVEKKRAGLRPCINYWGLIQCMVKYRYPLPLVSATLEQLRNAQFFTKLDLCNLAHILYAKGMNGKPPSEPHLANIKDF